MTTISEGVKAQVKDMVRDGLESAKRVAKAKRDLEQAMAESAALERHELHKAENQTLQNRKHEDEAREIWKDHGGLAY